MQYPSRMLQLELAPKESEVSPDSPIPTSGYDLDASNAASTPVQRLEYSKHLYVEREEVTLIADTANRLLNQDLSSDEPRTFVLYGEVGSGKSWLCKHLHRNVLSGLAPHGHLKSALICFDASQASHSAPNEWYPHANKPLDVSNENGNEAAALSRVEDWIAWLAPFFQQLHANVLALEATREMTREVAHHGADIAGMIEQMSAQVDEIVTQLQKWHARQKVFALILDSIFDNCDWGILEKLEEVLLARLAREPNVLIVMTGRGRLYPWESPNLSVQITHRKLRPFDEQQTAQQIYQKDNPSALVPNELPEPALAQAKQIIGLGGGIPLVNYLLAESHNPEDALPRAVDVVLENAGEEYKNDIKALAVLEDGFRENEIPIMRQAMLPVAGLAISPVEIRRIRDELSDKRLVSWDRGRYIVDSGIRKLIQERIRLKSPEEWDRLNEAAEKMYAEWEEKFASFKSSTYFRNRKDFHREKRVHTVARLKPVPLPSGLN
jgi:hypothetical protein